METVKKINDGHSRVKKEQVTDEIQNYLEKFSIWIAHKEKRKHRQKSRCANKFTSKQSL
jgi:hypothetical protein